MSISTDGIAQALSCGLQKVSYDYTPDWVRGNPVTYIDKVIFPQVIAAKNFRYRVIAGGSDLGVQPGDGIGRDGSEMVDFLVFNGGHGIAETIQIKVYLVDRATGNNYLIAQWN